MPFESELNTLHRQSLVLAGVYQYNPDRLMRIAKNALKEIDRLEKTLDWGRFEDKMRLAESMSVGHYWANWLGLMDIRVEYRKAAILGTAT